jgi:NTP pyrophosphatase (non-canonical NTP hydrolase)
MAQLSEEVGEVTRVMNRMYCPKKAKNSKEVKRLEEELIDALFPISCISIEKR